MQADKEKFSVTKNGTWKQTLRSSLFEPSVVEQLQKEYKASEPYRHLVISELMDDTVLKGACEELKNNMQATLKETDIFKVYQTGDLANMDGLPEESKRLLPCLFTIRDGLYSLEFRRLVQSLTGSGPLSGEQIDLSVNAFGHTGHLLCHDDVIGTRKVSYILYLVDEDWDSGEKPDGGGLQLYPLEQEGVPGIPAYAPSKTIRPRWNQMVLFAVQPGRSFHDVQEVYNEKKPRLAVSGWFHGAVESEMGDWPGHTLSTAANEGKVNGADGGERESAVDPGAASTLEQLKGKGAAGEDVAGGGREDGSPGAFADDFVGTEDLEELAEWVNPEYLVPSMVDQCAEAFNDNGSTIQLHRFLKDDVAKKLVDAVIAADKRDGLGYMEASPFEVGVRGGWRKAGPPHRQRMLRLSVTNTGEATEAEDDEIGSLLRQLRDKVFRSRAFKALVEKLVQAPIVASRRQARRFRPGLDYTLATPGVPWEFKGDDPSSDKTTASAEAETAVSSRPGSGDKIRGARGFNEDKMERCKDGGREEGGQEFMVLDAVLCFVDDREPYKEAAWRQDEVGGYVTYLAGDDDDRMDDVQDEHNGGGGEGNGTRCISSAEGGRNDTAKILDDGQGQGKRGETNNVGVKGKGFKRDGQANDAAVYKADEDGLLVSVSATSNALSLVLRDDTDILSFVKYVSSAAPGSRFDLCGEYLVLGGGDSESDSGDDQEEARKVLRRQSAPLEAVVEEEEEEEGEAETKHPRKKVRAS